MAQDPDDDNKEPESPFDKIDRAFGNLPGSLSEVFGRLKKTGDSSDTEKLGQKDAAARKTILQNDFFRVVKKGNVAEVEKLLDAGVDINAWHPDGNTALHIATKENLPGVVRLLLSRGANAAQGRKDDDLRTPLEDAISYNKPEIAELLARHGGYKPGEIMKDGWTLLHRACEKGRAQIVGALLRAGANGNEKTGNGATPLMIAVQRKQQEVAQTLLRFKDVVEGMNVHYADTDERKRTAFQLAVARGDTALAAAMIAKGGDVNAADAGGMPPLMRAIMDNNIDMARLLVKAGADVNRKYGSHGDTPLYAACQPDNISNDTARVEVIEFLLRAGADPDVASNDGETPLMLCLNVPDGDIPVLTLLRYRAGTEIRDKEGATALFSAVCNVDSRRTEILLEAESNPDARHGRDARTPLIHAVMHDSAQNVRALLRYGANPRLLDGHGRSALSYAREKGLAEIVTLLEESLKKKAVTAPKKPLQAPREWKL